MSQSMHIYNFNIDIRIALSVVLIREVNYRV